MTSFLRCRMMIVLLCLAITAACAPTKTLEVWKDEAYARPIHKVLVILVAQQDFIREQFEDVLSQKLADRGIEAIPSYTVLPPGQGKVDREKVLSIVQELGVDSVLVAKSIGRKEITNHQTGGVFFAPTAVYNDGWYSFFEGTLVYTDRYYDKEYFTVATNLFDVSSTKPVWSYLSQVRVEGSRQAAVNRFIPTVMQSLEENKLIPLSLKAQK